MVVETAVKVGFLESTGTTGAQNRGQVMALNHQSQGGHNYCNGQKDQNGHLGSIVGAYFQFF